MLKAQINQDSNEAAPPKKVTKNDIEEEEEGKVSQDHPNEIIIKGLPYTADEHDITNFFQECGAIESVNLLKGPEDRSKGIAFIRFSTVESLESAVRLNGSDFGGRVVTIEKTFPRSLVAPAGGFKAPVTERDPTSPRIFVANLSYITTEDSLRAFFESCGQIVNVKLAKDQEGTSRGFAHIDFMSPDSVESAVQKAGQKLDGRPIRVDYSTNRKSAGGQLGLFGGGFTDGSRQIGFGGNQSGGFFGQRINLDKKEEKASENHTNEIVVKGLPFVFAEQDLTDFFKECGAIESLNVLKGPDGMSKGIAFIKFSTEEAVESAVGLDGSGFHGRLLTIEKTVTREQKDPTPACIFVGNLSYITTEDSLRALFESCGQIVNVRLAKDPEGRPKGFGHVEFASHNSIEAALQKAGDLLDGIHQS